MDSCNQDDFVLTSSLKRLLPRPQIRSNDEQLFTPVDLFDTVDSIAPYQKFTLPIPIPLSVEITSRPQYKCWKCGDIYEKELWLKRHVFRCRKHKQPEELCEKKDENGELRFVCMTCGHLFLFKHALVRHIRTHTGEKPYKCFHCPKMFIDSGERKRHARRHHGDRVIIHE